MTNNIGLSFLKFIILFTTFLFLIFLAKKVVFQKLNSKDIPTKLFCANNLKSKNVFFLGTSRTKYSINSAVFKSKLPDYNIVNAGNVGGTFNSTAALACEIMKKSPSSIFFIELSIANGRVPNSFSLLVNPNTMVSSHWSVIKKGGINDMLYIHIPFFERYFLDYLHLKPYLNVFLNQESLDNILQQRKFFDTAEYISNLIIDGNEMLDSNSSESNYPIIYDYLFTQLFKSAKESNSLVYFYLPTATINSDEKNRLIAIYTKIPNKFKVVYDSKFLRDLNKPKFMVDQSHMNVYGAKFYSSYMANYLVNHANMLSK